MFYHSRDYQQQQLIRYWLRKEAESCRFFLWTNYCIAPKIERKTEKK
jgi:hypothetical protein